MISQKIAVLDRANPWSVNCLGKTMNLLKHNFVTKLLALGFTLLGLTACDPFEKQRAEQAEKTRIECLDKLCYGDVLPVKIPNTAIFKLNGQWYVGPNEYYTSSGPRGFIWWQHQPLSSGSTQPPELETLIADGKGYDVSIEIFFTGRQRWPTPNVEKPWEAGTWVKEFDRIQAEGLRMQWKTVTPQLDIVSFSYANGKAYDTTYYVASQQKNIRGGEAPVAICRSDKLNPNARCFASAFWQDDVLADFRFRAKHAQDWPAIHQEIIRTLNLAKKEQS